MNLQNAIKRYENMLRLRNSGATLQEIGDMYGVTRQAVFERLKKGMPTNETSAHGILSESGWGHLKGRERARMMVRIRDNFTCQNCGLVKDSKDVEKKNSEKRLGMFKSLDVHHLGGDCGVKTKAYDKTSDLSKLVTLCHKCHFNHPEHVFKNKAIK